MTLPWYNRSDWLGGKKRSYLLTYKIILKIYATRPHLKATLFYLSLHRKAAEFVLHRLDGQRCEPFSCFHTESVTGAKSKDSVRIHKNILKIYAARPHLKATLFYLSLHRKAAEFVLHRVDGQRCEPFSCFHTESGSYGSQVTRQCS